MSAGKLLVAAAPIGCAGDASARLAGALTEATVIAAEDTRRIRRLAADLGIHLTAPVVSYYEAVEHQRVDRLLPALRAGGDVLLVTDAGMPGIRHPAYRVVKAAAPAGPPATPPPRPRP